MTTQSSATQNHTQARDGAIDGPDSRNCWDKPRCALLLLPKDGGDITFHALSAVCYTFHMQGPALACHVHIDRLEKWGH